ncbi:MAG: thioredoxin domain-containing protein [Xanthobacteraceae bacterium]
MKQRRHRPARRKIAAFAALTLVIALSSPGVVLAQGRHAASEAEYHLVGDEGQRLPNHTVKLLGPIDRLPGVVVAGNPKGKETLIEFYDLNCPFCRLAASDIGDMLKHDSQLRLVLVPYPVLGIPSIGAARVELAVAKLGTPEQFYAFHRKVYAQRGTTDGPRALEIARGLGLNAQNLLALADSDQITDTMKNLVSLGTTLGLEATPSFIVGNLAILGYPGPRALQALVSAVATCGKAVC